MSYEERLCEAADEGFPSDAWAVDMHTAGKIGKEADETIQHLRTQLAASEAACAGYRAALEKAEYETQSFVTAFERGQLQNRHRDGGKAALLVIRQALESNPAKPWAT